MATVTPLIQSEGPKLSDVQIEIQNVVDARCKLQNLIVGLNKQRADTELAFLREFSRDLAALKVDFDRSFVDGAFSKYTSVKQSEDQITQRTTALGEIAIRIERRIDEFKKANREDLMLVLERELEKLKSARAVQEKETDFLDNEIDRLQKELSQLEGTGQKKAPQYQAETASQPPKGKA
jgi:predicted  nucleic acid-binding Zn-ribbon protein